MINRYGKFRVINIHFDDLGERQHAFELLEISGIPISDRLKDAASYRPFPHSTHLLHVQLESRYLDYCPQPFICAAIVSSGSRIYTVQEFERIVETGFSIEPRFPIFHVPHDGWRFPEELMKSVCVQKDVFMDYHERMRDKDVFRMIPQPYNSQHMCQRFEVSRLLCDVERFIGPDEIMEQYGMGFCYMKAFDGKRIKHMTDELRAETLKHYNEHHDRVNKICQWHKRILFFDMHSYTNEILSPHAINPGKRTPDLCIGTDERFTPLRLVNTVMRRFSEMGFSIEVNKPYAGVYIPETAMGDDPGCDLIGIMLEFNRRAYCDDNGNTLPDRIEVIKACIKQIMADCVDMGQTTQAGLEKEIANSNHRC